MLYILYHHLMYLPLHDESIAVTVIDERIHHAADVLLCLVGRMLTCPLAD